MFTGPGDGLRIPVADVTSGRTGLEVWCTPLGDGVWFTTTSCWTTVGIRSLGPACRTGVDEVTGRTAAPRGLMTTCGLFGGTGGGTPLMAGPGPRGEVTLAGGTTWCTGWLALMLTFGSMWSAVAPELMSRSTGDFATPADVGPVLNSREASISGESFGTETATGVRRRSAEFGGVGETVRSEM